MTGRQHGVRERGLLARILDYIDAHVTLGTGLVGPHPCVPCAGMGVVTTCPAGRMGGAPDGG